MFKHNFYFLIALICIFSSKTNAQTNYIQKDTNSFEHIRGESGIDPIIIHSKVSFTSIINNPDGPSGLITNTFSFTFAVKHWSIGLDESLVTIMSGNPGDGFHSSAGDLKLTLSNKIYSIGKHSFAVSGKLAFPTGKKEFGSQYFSLTPVFTYTYSPVKSLIIALQPQYSFSLMKDPLYPKLSLLTVKALFAKFTRTGYVLGIELKPTLNFTSDVFDFYISPFVSKSLGSGFNLMILCDMPVNTSANAKGPNIQIGINRNF
jgi:hypothetical protein